MEDQSNTYNDIDTHEVLQVTNSRSEMSSELTRMTSIPETDCEPNPVIERAETVLDRNNERDIIDAVILHAQDDRQLALDFIQNMKTEFPELQLDLKIFEQLHIGRSILESASLLFRTCRFIFVFETRNIEQDELSNFVSQMLFL
ncbi:uncharacterized protein [Mytilus edulis]|uniref:uncharacterized protein n=1 Tax=Mytilus edulis TaxID=6550 RepID=UPI0039EFC782